MSAAHIRIWPELPTATIRPTVYGHFAEHLGRCIQEGIWVGLGSRIPNDAGLRVDVLAALKQLRAPVIRWPGGCFADAYHWRDGIGPQKSRPERVNVWWKQSEPNEFGTDEYIRFCRAVGCEPYICMNVGSGSPREAVEWLEYCNFGGSSTLARMREKNAVDAGLDSGEPYGVKYWGIGNENWGCGGRFAATDYAKEYRRFAMYLRALDPSIELIACGHTPCSDDPSAAQWNRDFCQTLGDAGLIDHLSIHRYFHRGHGATFSDSEYRALFGDLAALERDLEAAEHLLAYAYPDKFVGIIVDEWGTWHPSAVVENGLEMENTLRDGVFAGAALNLFNRHARRVTMANIAQTVNVLQSMANTDGANMYVTPTYHVFDMMRPHMGAQALTFRLECPEFECHPVGFHTKHRIPHLSVSASVTGKKVCLSVANQTTGEDVEACISLAGASIASVTGRVLHTDDARDMNSFSSPRKVAPKRLTAEVGNGTVTHCFPAHSFTVMNLTLA